MAVTRVQKTLGVVEIGGEAEAENRGADRHRHEQPPAAARHVLERGCGRRWLLLAMPIGATILGLSLAADFDDS